jgi:hypothetical protein
VVQKEKVVDLRGTCPPFDANPCAYHITDLAAMPRIFV